MPRYGIAPRSWVAGVRAFELVPREDGGFSHAHLLVIRRAWVPFGKALANMPQEPRPEDLGTRALLRSLGLGEVMRYDDVTTDRDGEGATAVEAYMGKVEAYMGKLEKGDDTSSRRTWAGRSDLQRAMRGARLVEAFGDARGLLGGPDETSRTRDGVPCAPWVLEGTYDPADPLTWSVLPDGVAVEDGPEVTIDRRTYYRQDTLDTWREWCDVDALVAGMRLDGRPAPPNAVKGGDKLHRVAERAEGRTPPEAKTRGVPAPRSAGDDDGKATTTKTAAGHPSTARARASSDRRREISVSARRKARRVSASSG